MKDAATDLPNIDLTDADTESGAERAAIQIMSAFSQVGVARITGHGVPEAVIERMIDVTRGFFHLPLADKQMSAAAPPSRYRGYCSADDGVPAGQSPAELWESFEFNRYDYPADAIADGYSDKSARVLESNLWPSQPPEFVAVCQEYFSAMGDLMYRFLRLCARALSLEPGWFADRFAPHCSYLSLNFYPPQVVAPQRQQLRQVPHTDIAGPTFLYQDSDVGGLEIEGHDGNWLPVAYQSGTYIAFMADLMARWTNDTWRSSRHRVVNPPRSAAGLDRLSLAYFSYPRLDSIVDVVPTCQRDGHMQKYPPISVVDWVTQRMGRS